jgi:EAL domain-containing protein (putative c-di-GMP-specific phosphodiesterase class I)
MEITEGILMHDHAVLQVASLRAMGVRVSIDDFGTGYSSLGYLQRIPVDEVKLDRSLMDGLGIDNRTSAVLGAIVNLAHTLDLQVVGEGVETDYQWETLRQLRCDNAQGYYMCPPLGIDRLEAWLGDAEQAKNVPLVPR